MVELVCSNVIIDLMTDFYFPEKGVGRYGGGGGGGGGYKGRRCRPKKVGYQSLNNSFSEDKEIIIQYFRLWRNVQDSMTLHVISI